MNRIKIYFIGILILTGSAYAQESKIDSNYANWYYLQRMEYFNEMPAVKNAIVFLGNSITERAEWGELLADSKFPIVNRGIGGDNSFGILARIDEVLRARPKSIFLMDGINDQFRRLPHEVSIYNYRRIIKRIKNVSPKTVIYLQSALPINETLTTESYTKGRNALVPDLNAKLKLLAQQEGITYIDICPLFQDSQGILDPEFTLDGIHLKPAAYMKWVDFLKRSGYLKI